MTTTTPHPAPASRSHRGRPGDVRHGLQLGLQARSRRRCSTSTRRASGCSGTRRPTSTGRSTSIPSAFPRVFPPEAFNAILNPPERLDAARSCAHESISCAWMLSQFMHGEQGALLATAQIVNTVPWTEAKFYAASQVADEARHVEVYRRYLTEKLPSRYPGQPAPAHAARPDHQRVALGHDLPRHADHGRRPGAGRLRADALHQPGRAADPADHRLRDARRGAPRRLRRAVAAGALHQGDVVDRAARARGVRHRGHRC